MCLPRVFPSRKLVQPNECESELSSQTETGPLEAWEKLSRPAVDAIQGTEVELGCAVSFPSCDFRTVDVLGPCDGGAESKDNGDSHSIVRQTLLLQVETEISSKDFGGGGVEGVQNSKGQGDV